MLRRRAPEVLSKNKNKEFIFDIPMLRKHGRYPKASRKDVVTVITGVDDCYIVMK